MGQGDKIAVAGFGGLGHLAVQYAVSFGAEVTVFDISEDKRTDAIRMGATKYVNVNNPEEWKGLENSFRVILSTIPAKFNVEQYVRMLKVDGEMVLICSFSSYKQSMSINGIRCACNKSNIIFSIYNFYIIRLRRQYCFNLVNFIS